MRDTLSQKIYGFALKKLGANDIPEKQLYDKLIEKFITKKSSYNSIQREYSDDSEEIYEKITEIIELLKSQKYLDDIRFCENFIRWRKEAMPRGKYMIIQELIQKKIESNTATELCNKHISYNDELQMCETLLLPKYKKLQQKYLFPAELNKEINTELNTDEIHHKIKQKLFFYLAGKQFSYSLINEVWEKIK